MIYASCPPRDFQWQTATRGDTPIKKSHVFSVAEIPIHFPLSPALGIVPLIPITYPISKYWEWVRSIRITNYFEIYHILSYTIIYHHIPSYTIIYHHIPSHTIIYPSWKWYNKALDTHFIPMKSATLSLPLLTSARRRTKCTQQSGVAETT